MATVKLKIPYRSQWDEDANEHESDCGPTCVAMLLNGLNVEITPNGTYHFIGAKGRRQFTTFTDLRNAALGGGTLTLTYKQYRNETDALQQLRNNIDAGFAFIALVKYEPWRSFTGNQFSGGHFVNIVGYSDTHVIIHDPLFGLWAPREKGEYYSITNRRFIQGWGGFPITENPNFSGLLTDKPFEFQRKPREEESVIPVEKPEIDDDLRRRIYSLAAFEGKLTPDLDNTETAVYWVNHVGNWAKKTTLHIVQSGNTYSQIAAEYYEDSALWRAIQKYNRLPNTVLFIGQRLQIPLPGEDIVEAEVGPNIPAEVHPDGVVPLPGHGGPEVDVHAETAVSTPILSRGSNAPSRPDVV
jgi:LysM repeat protein